MNQILGSTVGNAVEMQEVVDYLTGNYREKRLHAVTMELAIMMLQVVGIEKDRNKAEEKIMQALSSGRAAAIFEKMVAALGGPSDIIDNPGKYLKSAKIIKPILAENTGYIAEMKTRDIGMAVVELGGGRVSHTQDIDHSVGLTDIVPLGSQVKKGEQIALIHANSEAEAKRGSSQYLKALSIDSNKPEPQPVIYEFIG